MNYTVLNRDELPHDKHPYKEVFIIQEGAATFTVEPTVLEAHAGQIIIVPADVPHKLRDSGAGPLRQVDIHMSKRFITYWPIADAIKNDPAIAGLMNQMPKIVFSRTLDRANWENTRLIKDHN